MLLVHNRSRRPIVARIPSGYTGPPLRDTGRDPFTKSLQINPGHLLSMSDAFADSRTIQAAIAAGYL